MAHKHLRGRHKQRSQVKKKGKLRKEPVSTKKKDEGKGGGKGDTKSEGEKAKVAGSAGAQVEKKLTKAEARALAQAEEQHRALYEAGERVLLVGEGNFSFARALCGALGDGAGVYATAYDPEATLYKKYPDAVGFRKEIEEKFGGTTLVGVDATRIHKVKEFKGAFKKIVWNFPHIGSGETDVDKSVAEHRRLLAEFFSSAAQCLSDEKGAAIHVALKLGEPYKSWKVAQTGRASLPAELDLLTAVPFAPSAWENYAHRRTQGFDARLSKADSEELAKGAKVYVFGRPRKGTTRK